MAKPQVVRAEGLGKRLRTRMIEVEMSAAALITASGLSRQTVYRALSSDEATRETAAALEGALELEPGSLLGETALGPSPVVTRAELPPDVAKAARRLVDAFKREAAVAGCTPEELHYIETVLMSPNLPPVLAGGSVPPERLLEHIQAMMEPLRIFFRDGGRAF